MDNMSKPLDPKTFMMMMDVFQAAADLTMPTLNPEEAAKFQLDDGSTIRFTDRPMNRGMLEVNRQLRELGVEPRQAYTARIMQFSDILDAADRFGDLIKPGEELHSMLIDEVVYEACATARFHMSGDHFGYDVDDVIARAKALKAAEEAQAQA